MAKHKVVSLADGAYSTTRKQRKAAGAPLIGWTPGPQTRGQKIKRALIG